MGHAFSDRRRELEPMPAEAPSDIEAFGFFDCAENWIVIGSNGYRPGPPACSDSKLLFPARKVRVEYRRLSNSVNIVLVLAGARAKAIF